MTNDTFQEWFCLNNRATFSIAAAAQLFERHLQILLRCHGSRISPFTGSINEYERRDSEVRSLVERNKFKHAEAQTWKQ